MRRLVTVAAAVMISVGLVPAALAAPQGPKQKTYFVDESRLPFTALPGATAYYGVHAGAGYRIEVPANWNGDLVMWAHGYRGTGLELTVDNHPLREFLIASGYAWAASSYTSNDYNVGDGVKSTRQLASFFNGLVGQADKVYITGASMGGHITAVSIEQYPNAYAGAMPICGVLADVELFDFFADFNLAAQFLGGSSQQGFPIADPAMWLGADLPAIKSNLSAVPGGWPVALNPAGQNLKALTQLRSGGARPNFDQAWLFWNAVAVDFLFNLAIDTGTIPVNGSGVDNSDVIYQFDLDPTLNPAEQAFNDGVLRMTADPQARHPNGLAGVPPTSGDITVPVLSLHNLGDLFVPFHNEVIYGRRVAASGKSDLLVQRAIRGVNHCDFTGLELIRGFSDLVTWVETGVKPAGDAVTDPIAVAAPDFGCAFTDFSGALGSHVLPAPCP